GLLRDVVRVVELLQGRDAPVQVVEHRRGVAARVVDGQVVRVVDAVDRAHDQAFGGQAAGAGVRVSDGARGPGVADDPDVGELDRALVQGAFFQRDADLLDVRPVARRLRGDVERDLERVPGRSAEGDRRRRQRAAARRVEELAVVRVVRVRDVA